MWIAVRAVGFVQPVPDVSLTVVKQCEEFGEIMRDGWGIAVVMTVVVALAVSRFGEVDVDVLPLCSASDEIPVAADIANRFRPFVWIKAAVGRDEIASANDFDVLLRSMPSVSA